MNLKWHREWKVDTDSVIVSDGLNVQMGETLAICRVADDWGAKCLIRSLMNFTHIKFWCFHSGVVGNSSLLG